MSFRWWCVIATGLYLSGLILGLLLPVESNGLLSGQVSALDELASIISPLPESSLFIFIFLKNLSVIVISFMLGPLLCLFPLATLVINGGVIGLVSSVISREVSVTFLLVGLLPHGVFELPALLIGEAACLSFGAAVTLGIVNREKRGRIVPNLKHNMKYLGISAGLFLIAALLETWLTPRLLNMVGP